MRPRLSIQLGLMVEKPSVSKIRALLHRGRELLSGETIESAAYKAWTQSVAVRLQEAFGNTQYALPWPSTRLNADRQEYVRKALIEQLNYLEEILKHETDRMNATDSHQRGSEPDLLDSFVSHSSKDEKLAIALVSLLRAAIDIRHDMIRCTSAPGYKLQVGSDFEAQLQTETLRSTTFIPLVTPNSLQSMFTGFEMGARWGSTREMFPILARGATAGSIGRPLSSSTMISGTKKDEVCDFVSAVAAKLRRPVHPTSVWLKQLEEFVALAGENVTSVAEVPPTPQPPTLPQEAIKLLLAASESSGRIMRVGDMRVLKVHAGRFAVELTDPHERAIWKDGIDQLVARGFAEQTGKDVFRLVKAGFDLAVELRKSSTDGTSPKTADGDVFTEHNGLKFKRKSNGTYHLAAYCPSCLMTLGGEHPSEPLSCSKCGFTSHYTGYHVPDLVEEVQKG